MSPNATFLYVIGVNPGATLRVRRLLCKLTQEFSEEECQAIVYSRFCKCRELDVLSKLEMYDVFSPINPAGAIEGKMLTATVANQQCRMVKHVKKQETLEAMQPPTHSSIPASSPTSPTSANLLQPKTYTEGDLRCCELTVPEDIPQAARILPLQALFFSADLCYKYKNCMKELCDLKVSNDVRAKLCEFDFDLEQTKLVFTLPKECKSFSFIKQ